MKTLKRIPTHPGEILAEEFLKPLRISQRRIAKEIGIPVKTISGIISHKNSISPDIAKGLGKYFGTTMQFWLNLQRLYDLEIEKDKRWTYGDAGDFLNLSAKEQTILDHLVECRPKLDIKNFNILLCRIRKSIKKSGMKPKDIEKAVRIARLTGQNLRTITGMTTWPDVHKMLLKNYPEQRKNIEGYQKVYNRLKTIAPAKNTTSILINKLNKVGNELPYEIYGTDDTVKSKIKLSLSMMPWREWAGSTIDSETIKSFSIEEIVAHCLYEMTFYGFSQSKIRTAGKQLRAEIRDIEDSVRFIIVSRIFPRHKTYYDVTYDSWGTEIGSATLFKRENAARAVTSLLDNSDMSVAKITVKNGSRRIIRYLDTGRIKAGRHHGRRRDFRKLLNQVSDQKPDAHDTL